MKFTGIDVSAYQQNVDYAKLKRAGVQFVIIRAGYGDVISYPDQKDTMFEAHYRAAKAAGVSVGAYWYSYATTPAGARREAQGFIQTIKGKQFDYPVFIDLEERKQFDTGKDNCSAMVTAFNNTMEAAGYWAGLYISRSPCQSYIKPEVAERYTLWLAEYSSACHYSGTVDMWQYTSSARYSGYIGNLDGDISYQDYPARIKAAGKNGYPKPDKVLDTKGMKEGDKNTGVYYLKSFLQLYEARYGLPVHVTAGDSFGTGTTQDVNYMLRSWGYKANGIAGKGFADMLVKKLK